MLPAIPPQGSSLFSRPKPPPKPVRGFMALPGELRNRIYEYYFQDGFRLELSCAHPDAHAPMHRPQPKTVKLYLPIIDKVGYSCQQKAEKAEERGPRILTQSRYLGSRSQVDRLSTKWQTSLCPLILVCRHIYEETIPFLYQNTTFVFVAPRRIDNFLACVGKTKISLITKLHLCYSAYGNPAKTIYRGLKSKHLARWYKTCKAMSKSLHSLKELELWVHLSTSDPYLSLREEQLQPLFCFRRLMSRRNASSANSNNDNDQAKSVIVHFGTQQTCRQRVGWPKELRAVSDELHQLFGEAIARFILGWTEEEAMAALKEAWLRHQQWHLYLRYLD